MPPAATPLPSPGNVALTLSVNAALFAIFALACWWKHIGGTYADFKQIMPTWADSSYNHQLDRLEREWINLK